MQILFLGEKRLSDGNCKTEKIYLDRARPCEASDIRDTRKGMIYELSLTRKSSVVIMKLELGGTNHG